MGRVAIIALLCTFALYVESAKKDYTGYSVYRVNAATKDQLKVLHDLVENDISFDFWTYPSMLNASIDIMTSAENKIKLLKILSKNKIRNELLIRNVQENIAREDAEQARYFARQTRDIFDGYARHSDINTYLDSIVTGNPAIAAVSTIGTSYGGRALKQIRLGINSSGSKPVIVIDSAIHAREWISAATTLYFVQSLVDGYNNNDASIRAILTKFDWYILPVANPDGYEYTFTNDRMWRKTRRPNSGSTCVGTDPNRNFDYQWNTVGASTNPCSDIYAGPNAFSEPETKAISDNIKALNTNKRVKIYLATHSYSQLWLYPWGWTSALPPDSGEMHAKGQICVNALTSYYGTRYTIGSSTNVLYAAAGGADDWAYGAEGVIYSYTPELRDTGTYGFQLPASQIRPSGIETFACVLALAQSVTV